MKKLYLLLLVFLLLFIPATNAVTSYQLDHPIKELNNHTLREVFEDGQLIKNSNFVSSADWILSGNMSISNDTMIKTPGALGQGYQTNVLVQNNIYYTVIDVLSHTDGLLRIFFGGSDVYTINTFSSNIGYNSGLSDSGATNGNLGIYSQSNSEYILKGVYTYNLTVLGLTHLTIEQMDKYYDYYLEAVQFEIDYYEAGQDPGEYQLIFKSILNGVKNLISEMGGVWKFLNAPIVSTNPDDFGFNIDWSWDLIGVVKQIFNNLAVIVLQVSFLIPTAIFNIFNIPVQISLLSLLFTNFVFVLLGWIVVKSFII